MLDITVDACIIQSGFGKGDKFDQKECFDLTKKIITKKDYHLALDNKGKILHQYKTKLSNSEDGKLWLKQILTSQKFKDIDIKTNKLPKSTLIKLQKAHFDSSRGEDIKYVETSANSECKILATVDFCCSYQPKVCKILNQDLSVQVKKPCDI